MDVDNYRAIAISNTETKIFESVILFYIMMTLNVICTSLDSKRLFYCFMRVFSVLKRTINSYVNRGSDVIACFVDFRKAFDRVNYWKLFTQLLDEGSDVGFVKLLAFWYSRQTISVYWQGLYSDKITIWATVPDRGCLVSPLVYSVCASTNQTHITKQCRMRYRWIVCKYTSICRWCF